MISSQGCPFVIKYQLSTNVFCEDKHLKDSIMSLLDTFGEWVCGGGAKIEKTYILLRLFTSFVFHRVELGQLILSLLPSAASFAVTAFPLPSAIL